MILLFLLLIYNSGLIDKNAAVDTRQIEVKIKAYEDKVGFLDILILQAELINLSNQIKPIYDSQESWLEIRKVESKEWQYILSLNPLVGGYSVSEPHTIYFEPNSVLKFNIGASFYTNELNEKGVLKWKGREPGKYEIRLAYKLSSDEDGQEVIYSNIVNFAIFKYNGIDAAASKYLLQLPVPHFLQDAYRFGSNYALNSNRMNVKEVSKQLISKYPKSRFAIWAKLYLIEMEAYKMFDEPVDKATIEKKVLEFEKDKNPFIQERLIFLLNHISK